MKRYKHEEDYNHQIITAFKESDNPEILIVVSKLLTGFDAPRNTVLYICKSLKEHNLLQAIARVNRIYENDNTSQEKQFGLILDYEGLLGELDHALNTYSAFVNYDPADLQGTVHDVREEIRRLPQLREQLWDLFKPVRNKKDMEQLEQHLGDDSVREALYERLRAFSRCLHIGLSSDKLPDVFNEKQADAMKDDWRQFSDLKRSVQLRYQETVSLHTFEPKIRQLLDAHVVAMPAETVIDPVNINDPDALKAVVTETGEDHGQDVPQVLQGNDHAQAVFGILKERLCGNHGIQVNHGEVAAMALAIMEIIQKHLMVGLWSNEEAQNRLRNAMDDFFFDVVRDQQGIAVPEKILDELQRKIMAMARARFVR